MNIGNCLLVFVECFFTVSGVVIAAFCLIDEKNIKSALIYCAISAFWLMLAIHDIVHSFIK